jgi:hypothetical protein
MSILRFFSVPRAYRDARRLLLSRRNWYEVWFLLLAMAVASAVIAGFVHDSRVVPAYHEDIVYVQSWPLDRSEAEILADQKLYAAKKAKEQAAIEKAEKERQAQFQRLQNATAPWL